MMLKLITILMFFASHVIHAKDCRSVERNLSSLANIVVPYVNFTDDTTVSEAIDFLNLLLRSPDPPPPKSWKIRLNVSQKIKDSKIILKGKDLRLHEVLGKIADQIGADLVVKRRGYILQARTKKSAEQVVAPDA